MSYTTTTTKEFKIPMTGNQVKRHQVTAMHLIAAILFIVMGFVSFVTPFALGMARSVNNIPAKAQIHWVNISGLVLAGLGIAIIIMVIFFGKKVTKGVANLVIRLLEIAAFACILTYSLVNEWYLPAAYSGAGLIGIFVAYLLERSGNSQKYTTVNQQGVRLQGTGKNVNLSWREIKAVILKHNVLTVDLRNNKLYQLTYFNKENIPTAKIEQFAAEQIKAHENDKGEDW